MGYEINRGYGRQLPVRLRLAWLAAALLILSACAKPPSVEPPGPGFTGRPPKTGIPDATIEDLRKLPQDASYYLDPGKAQAPLLSPESARMYNQAWLTYYFGPWRRENPGNPKSRALWAFRKAGKKHPTGLASQLAANADIKRYPNTRRKAITVANTNLRALPTATPRYNGQTAPNGEQAFDFLQNSAVWANTPVFISHTSRDGAWVLAEAPFAHGWIPAQDVAFVDPAFMSAFETGTYAAIVKEKVPLIGESCPAGLSARIGAVCPVIRQEKDALVCAVAARNPDGSAKLAQTRFSRGEAALLPLAPTPANIAAVANQLMGEPYGWGGTNGYRDCSATTRDIFVPFGIWLPRNSAAQAKRGAFISLGHLSPEEKEKAIIRQGVPLLTLVWIKGHIMLYIGQMDGRVLVYHNIWGVRTFEPDGSSGREVIGKTVVTTLTPGRELQNVRPDKLLVNRVLGITLLAPAGQETCPLPAEGDEQEGSI